MSLDEFSREATIGEDEVSVDLFTRPCRCGGTYEVDSEELAEGINTLQCSDCSLHITVVEEP